LSIQSKVSIKGKEYMHQSPPWEIICTQMHEHTVMSLTASPEPPLPAWLALVEIVLGLLSKCWSGVSVGLGIPGNLMSLMITMKKDNRQISTCIYMAALAVVDSGVLILSEVLWKFLVLQRLVPEFYGNFVVLR
jgi:hypothetical protein